MRSMARRCQDALLGTFDICVAESHGPATTDSNLGIRQSRCMHC
jgi:hypothetical protein